MQRERPLPGTEPVKPKFEVEQPKPPVVTVSEEPPSQPPVYPSLTKKDSHLEQVTTKPDPEKRRVNYSRRRQSKAG